MKNKYKCESSNQRFMDDTDIQDEIDLFLEFGSDSDSSYESKYLFL